MFENYNFQNYSPSMEVNVISKLEMNVFSGLKLISFGGSQTLCLIVYFLRYYLTRLFMSVIVDSCGRGINKQFPCNHSKISHEHLSNITN